MIKQRDPRVEAIHAKRKAGGGWYGISTPPGWDDLIIELDAALAEIQPHYVIFQAKEKFGGLRYYCSGDGSEAARDIIREAERKSRSVCEDCGGDAQLRRRKHWYRTLCDDCASDEYEVVGDEEDDEDDF